MCMMLIQCFGRMNLGSCHAAQSADILQPCDALLAVLVDDVALSLDVRGFGRGAAQIAKLPVPLDAQLALVVECVATALDELGFARGAAHIAQLLVPLDAQLALVVECVATALDELASARGDSWSLSHLGYLYPGTTPVMIKLDHNRSCPWV